MKNSVFIWLQHTALWRIWLLLVLLSVLLSEAICSLMALLLKGAIPADYLITGLVISAVVAPLLVWMVTYFLDHLQHLQAYNTQLSKILAERKQAEQELLISSVAFDSHESMLITDDLCKIMRVNKTFTEITGYTTAEVLGKTPGIMDSDLHPAEFYAEIKNTAQHKGTWQGEVYDRRKNGEIYPTFLTVTSVKTEQGIISHYIVAHIDNSKNKAAAEKIERLAFYDPLTNLPNRRLLQDRLKQALVSSHRTNRKGALLFIDMDNFKTLNDSHGHDMGDLLLQQVAERLNGCIRENDTVARLGGDEFVVMLEELSEHTLDAASQAETIGHKILTLLNQAFQLNNYHYICTPSIGATLFYEAEQTLDTVLKQADIAMYQAKASGRNRLCFFDPQMQINLCNRVKLEDDLNLALTEQQFMLYFQPQVDQNYNILGAEALIRWQHPQHGFINPQDFIPLAEETSLILKIGQWVLETACAQIKAWEQSEHTRHLHLSINVSARQFQQPDFEQTVIRVMTGTGINPQRLKLELIEALVLQDHGNIARKMQTLRETGVKFAMDDFGTGHSSLASIKRLPIDQLKIDRSFVHDISIDKDDEAIVETIILMAKKLGLAVIAEGVETKEQLAFLELHNCKNFQGYLFGKPLPLAEFEGVLAHPLHSWTEIGLS